ncbi:hypothetical protein GQ53DRAFT_338817 [Thozetella sp. PMI_491]|nr:hypothetical protein GQ53DRAFT_338817 [Thozetella sp. PMI_491]
MTTRPCSSFPGQARCRLSRLSAPPWAWGREKKLTMVRTPPRSKVFEITQMTVQRRRLGHTKQAHPTSPQGPSPGDAPCSRLVSPANQHAASGPKRHSVLLRDRYSLNTNAENIPKRDCAIVAKHGGTLSAFPMTAEVPLRAQLGWAGARSGGSVNWKKVKESRTVPTGCPDRHKLVMFLHAMDASFPTS